ncbi:MAG: hypothetical protein BWY86_01156 [Candidatus Aminicenantes bacterium ADurb.Bin508]|nr:MAG: hypothetical protein BWY86_01156 [Candidatus Aminicenantes bacterium ADurb.Bin508]HNX41307.1 DUF177 domain-containing protein [Candidatus Aminicenantes bacterium]HPS99484.1 DUF177 domain-containing protein [Candidatus Aminicenantes bacterium]
MKIFVDDIPQKGLTINEIFDLNPNELVEEGSFVNPVSCHIQIYREGDKVVVRGEVHTTLELLCSRCLAPYHEPVDSRFDLVFFEEDGDWDEENSEEAKEIQEEDVNTLFYENGLIDLDNVILDQINLSLPFKPLCGELCKGICPICGKDLNEGPCGCEVKRKDPRIQKITDTLRGK